MELLRDNIDGFRGIYFTSYICFSWQHSRNRVERLPTEVFKDFQDQSDLKLE